MTDRLRIRQGRQVGDALGNVYGILDWSDDAQGAAIALAVNPVGDEEGSTPVVRVGDVLQVGPARWRAAEVHTADPVYLLLESDVAAEHAGGAAGDDEAGDDEAGDTAR